MAEQEKIDPPSELFADIVCDGGTPVADCELCGRTHFATADRGVSWEPGEVERLRAKAAENPDKYIEYPSDDCIGFGHIDGKQVVFMCPCNRLSRYERFIICHQRMIVRFLKAINKAQQEKATEALTALGD